MSSYDDALSGEFEACWRVDIANALNSDNERVDEIRVTINATGFDGMIKAINKMGYSIDNVINYVAC